MTHAPSAPQGSTQQPARAPAPPPIPALPAEPGAATGGAVVVQKITLPTDAQRQIVENTIDAQRNAEQALRNAAEATRNAAQVGTVQPDQLPFDPNLLAMQARPLLGMVLGMVAIVFIGFPVLRAVLRRWERRGELGAVKAADLQPQIRQLQESLDAMAIELERISEAQRFQAKLLAERAPQALQGERRA